MARVQSLMRILTPPIMGCHPRCTCGIIHRSRGDVQQLLRHVLLIHRRVCNVNLVGICIAYYLVEFVVIFDLQHAIYTKCATDVALTRLHPLYTSI